MSFFAELQRRNVLRVGVAYVIASWILIQVAETIFPLFGFSDGPARIIVVVLAIGFPLALIFSWAYEITPDGLKLERDVDRSASVTHHTGRKLDRIIIVVLAVGIGYLAVDKFVFEPMRDIELVEETTAITRSNTLTESYGDNSIAVLPFVNMSDDSSNEYFSDGISEELLNLLAKIPELRVISRTSAFSYKGKATILADVARELNVVNILEGSVRKDGNRVRITVQLIDARSDTHLWSETYDRTLDDIFAVQDEIAAVVVDQLRVTLLGHSPTVSKTDPEAYAIYLQANQLSNMMTPDSLNKAATYYQEVLSIDPEYSPAWMGLAVVYNRTGGLRLMDTDEARALSMQALERAVEISPDSAEAHSHLAWDYFNYYGDYAKAAHHFERAVALAPTDTGIKGNISMFLTALGRNEQATQLAEFQVSRDPVNALAYNNLSIRYRYAGELVKAKQALKTALTLSPGFSGAEYEMGAVYLQEGDYAAAASAFERESVNIFGQVGNAMALYALGDTTNSDILLSDLISQYGDRIPYYIAQIMAFRGDFDDAFEWLEKARTSGDSEFTNIINEPLLGKLHDHPDWLPYLERTGKSPDQLAAINIDIEQFEGQ